MATTEAERTVDRFIATWDRGDVGEMLDYFTDDAVYHNMPMEPAVGKPAIRVLLSEMLVAMSGLRAEVHRQVSDGKDPWTHSQRAAVGSWGSRSTSS